MQSDLVSALTKFGGKGDTGGKAGRVVFKVVYVVNVLPLCITYCKCVTLASNWVTL